MPGLLLFISQVYYWRDSSQLRWLRVNRAMKSKAFPNNDPEPSGVVTGLIPYSNYKMYIVVANNRYEGPASNNIHFSTPEGGKNLSSEEQQNICVLYQTRASQLRLTCVVSCCIFVCSTICSQILQDPAATSGQYLCRLGPASRAQRYHYRIFPQVPDRYADPTSETPASTPGGFTVVTGCTFSKHNVVLYGPLRRNSKDLITEKEVVYFTKACKGFHTTPEPTSR